MTTARWRVSQHAVDRYRERIEPSHNAALARAILARLPERGTLVLVGYRGGAELWRDTRQPQRAEYVVSRDLRTGERKVVSVFNPSVQTADTGREIEIVMARGFARTEGSC